MIEARTTPPAGAFAQRLVTAAERVAIASLARRRARHPWRKADLLWPGFGDR